MIVVVAGTGIIIVSNILSRTSTPYAHPQLRTGEGGRTPEVVLVRVRQGRCRSGKQGCGVGVCCLVSE